MDRLTKEQRSLNMAKIKSKDTEPEKIVRSMLHRLGYRFRLHRKDLPGCPDIVFPGRNKIIFVHGCFWHRHEGCDLATMPKTRLKFWSEKFRRNLIRDNDIQLELKAAGWEIMVIWECETRSPADLQASLQAFLGK